MHSLLFILPLSAYTTAIKMKQAFIGHLSSTVTSAALLLACFFCFYVLLGVALKLFSGQQFPWQEVVRPFLICLLIAFWQPTVNLFDSIGEFVCNKLDVTLVDTADNGGLAAITAAVDAAEGIDEAADSPSYSGGDQEPVPFLKKVGAGVKNVAKHVGSWVKDKLSPKNLVLLFNLFYFIMKGVLGVLSQMYLVLLGILGPFAFAFGIIPQLNRVSNWIGSYIQYWLWYPMAMVVHGMVNWLAGSLLGADIRTEVLDATGDVLGMLSYSCIVTFAGIFMLCTIPKICSVVVNVSQDVISANLGRAASAGVSKGIDLLVKL